MNLFERSIHKLLKCMVKSNLIRAGDIQIQTINKSRGQSKQSDFDSNSYFCTNLKAPGRINYDEKKCDFRFFIKFLKVNLFDRSIHFIIHLL